MANTLEVVKPFFVMEVGDRFEKNDNGYYVSSTNSSYSLSSEDNSIESKYRSEYEISGTYASILVSEGILKEVDEKPFVNVFEEIDSLKSQYLYELDTLDEEFANKPECLKVEKTTVLTNLVTLLNHLSSLKK